MLESQTASLKPALLIFTAAFLATSILVYVISLFIDLSNNSALGIIALMGAAVPAGSKFFTANSRLPTKGERLRFAVMGSLIAVATSALFVVAGFLYYGVPLSTDNLAVALGIPPGDMTAILLIGLSIGLVLSVLVLYFAFNLGSRGALKQAAKQATK